jgi:hypothetical protein
MYQLGKRTRQHRRLRRNVKAAISLLAVFLFCLGSYKLLNLQTKPDATIQNAPAQTTNVVTKTAKLHIDNPLFGFDLPAGWKTFKPTANVTPPTFSYRSDGEQVQLLSIYVDTIPSNLAVNRVVVVTPDANGMSHGGVSDNCTSFTNPTDAEKNLGIASGKWQGTNFLCDIGNYERNVVGITSVNGINEVDLTGNTAHTHKFFFTYTDNSINPDFATFYDILDSFKMK